MGRNNKKKKDKRPGKTRGRSGRNARPPSADVRRSMNAAAQLGDVHSVRQLVTEHRADVNHAMPDDGVYVCVCVCVCV